MFCHHGRVAGVVVPGGSGSYGVGLRILQHILGVVGAVPVVVVNHDFGAEVRGGQRRSQCVAQECCLIGGRHQHSAISRRRIERLVLYAQRVHRHAGSLIALNGLH